MPTPDNADIWPSLPIDEWRDTCATLHLWTQIIGKIRLELSPYINHWWQVPLYITARGLTTSPIAYRTRAFQIDFDFCDHELRIKTNAGERATLALQPRSVAEFYSEVMGLLDGLGIIVKIWPVPVEIPDPIPFKEDHVHASYDPEYAQRFWRILVQSARVMTEFRARFIGKVSPVHFFWGGFDLALTRFSGRKAPEHPSVPNIADNITWEAYSHEVSSCGFWPGGNGIDATFYAYAYPEPEGFGRHPVQPKDAFYSNEMGEFFLPYESVRTAASPDDALLAFLQSTYEPAAELGKWDRAMLERVGDGGIK